MLFIKEKKLYYLFVMLLTGRQFWQEWIVTFVYFKFRNGNKCGGGSVSESAYLFNVNEEQIKNVSTTGSKTISHHVGVLNCKAD